MAKDSSKPKAIRVDDPSSVMGRSPFDKRGFGKPKEEEPKGKTTNQGGMGIYRHQHKG